MEEFLLVDDDSCGNCSNSLSSTNVTSRSNSPKIYNLDIVVHTVKENNALGVACEQVSVFTAIKDLLSCQFQTSETDRVTPDGHGVNHRDNDHLNSTNKSNEHGDVNVQVPLCLPCSLLLQDLYRSFKLFQSLRDGTSYISKLTHRMQQTFPISDSHNINGTVCDRVIQVGEYGNNESEVQTFEDPFGEEINVKVDPFAMATQANPLSTDRIVGGGVENAVRNPKNVQSRSLTSNNFPSATGTNIEIKTEVETISDSGFGLSVRAQEEMIHTAISDIAAEEVDPLGLIECEENPYAHSSAASAFNPINSGHEDDSDYNDIRRSRRFHSKSNTKSNQRTYSPQRSTEQHPDVSHLLFPASGSPPICDILGGDNIFSFPSSPASSSLSSFVSNRTVTMLPAGDQNFTTMSASPAPVTLRRYHFDIDQVLKQDRLTRDVVTRKIPANKFIVSQDRYNIANVLAQAIFKYEGLYQSPRLIANIAQDLVRTYPALGDITEKRQGYEMWACFPKNGASHASGYLYERINNQRTKLLKDLAQQKEDNDIDCEDSDSDEKWDSASEDTEDLSSDAEGDLNWLQQAPLTQEQEIIERMKRTVFYRRRLIRQHNGDVMQLKTIMPRLFDVKGMITADFDVRHPDLSNCLYSSWNKISPLLYKFAGTNSIPLSQLGIFADESHEWTEDQWAVIGLLLLPRLLASCIRKTTGALSTSSYSCQNEDDDSEEPLVKRLKPSSRKTSRASKTPTKKTMTTVKGGIQDSLDCLISFVPANTSVPELCKDSVGKYPRIVVLGNLPTLRANQIFILFNSVAVEPIETTFLSAIDCCFKTFIVLGLDFPPECKPIWQFIKYGCFNKKKSKAEYISPPVRALLSQIVPRLPTDNHEGI